MTVLFPNHPLKARLPDPDYQIEFEAAKSLGFDVQVFGFESLREGEVDSALATCQRADAANTPLLHRCWMMSENHYRQLHAGLTARNYAPVSSPEQYAEAHYLPNAYKHLQGHTPRTGWTNDKDGEIAWTLYCEFADKDAIIKDWVKSAKHRWKEACFIPARSSKAEFERVMRAFVDARVILFERGIVLREFHNFSHLEMDSKEQPRIDEHRMFFWRGKLLATTPSIQGEGPLTNLDKWQNLAGKFSSPFISMDVARETSGKWLVIEVGDGGVSGLPDSIDPRTFYSNLLASYPGTSAVRPN